METTSYSKRNINVEEIHFPEAIIDNQLVDEYVEEILRGEPLKPLKITEDEHNQQGPVYQLALPITPKDILFLAVAKKIRKLMPNKYSYVLCHVMQTVF